MIDVVKQGLSYLTNRSCQEILPVINFTRASMERADCQKSSKRVSMSERIVRHMDIVYEKVVLEKQAQPLQIVFALFTRKSLPY